MSDAAPPLPLLERISDRLNPILVRETQQAVRGRGFVVTISLALSCVALAALSAVNAEGRERAGFEVFQLSLVFLAPILFFVVPFGAFLSTRREVSGGTAEHLLLARLGPGAIVRGKLFAAMVQFALYLSLFAPLMALSYLLRGIDVPIIALTLGLALVVCVGATVFAIALGAGSATPHARALPYGVAALALGGFSLICMAGMHEFVRLLAVLIRRDDLWEFLFGFGVPFLALVALLWMGAAGFLAHPYENRSTRFRVFAFVAVVVGYVWIAILTDASGLDETAPILAIVLAPLLAFFWLFAVTEEQPLTPLVRKRVSRRGWLATLSIPFLPGGGRGFLFTLLLAALVFAGACLTPLIAAGLDPNNDLLGEAAMAWQYTILYAGIGRWLRGVLRPGARGTWIARLALPGIFVAACFVPLVLSVFLTGGMSYFNIFHIGNPITTIYFHTRGNQQAFPILLLGVACAAMVVAQARAMLRGIREVREASRERRRDAS